MENENTENNFDQSLYLDREALGYLEETRKWAYFLSIVGFIMSGLLVLVGLLMGTVLDGLGDSMPLPISMKSLSFVYVLFALLYFLPVLMLYRFSVSLKAAIHQNNRQKLNESFGNMNSLFRFVGVLTIIVLSLYAIFFIAALVFGIFRGLHS